MENLNKKIEQLPKQPGVYIFRGIQKEVLYIGKAKNLKNRVNSYFVKSSQHDHRITKMISLIHDLEWVVTLSESEALILENQLIKRQRPRYNVMLRDDKTYPYFKVTLGEPFPRILLTRKIKKDGSAYFGPYVSVVEARETLKVIRKHFPLRQSTMPLDGNKTYRPCLNFQMKQCMAPCAGHISQEEYGEMVRHVLQILKGNSEELNRELKAQMKKESSAMHYETAAKIRDQITALSRTLQKKPLVSPTKVDSDVFALIRSEGFAGVQVLFIRGGIALSSDLIFFKDGSYSDQEILRSALSKLYLNGDKFIPKEIWLPLILDEASMLEDYFHSKRGEKTRVLFPQRGKKRELLMMAQKNGEEKLASRIKEAQDEEVVLREVKNTLHLSRLPVRVEAFDISNFSGTDTVASMVVWENNQPLKSDYRKYKIRTVDGANDYASLKEVLERRYIKALSGKQPLPDLIIIDGGKGQLSSAVSILWEIGIKLNCVDVIGFAKGRSIKRSGKEQGGDDYEYVVKPGQKNEIRLKRNSVSLYFLQKVRDEAHRFAIEFHRKRRSKRTFSSLLDQISGIGPAKKKMLLKTFGSLQDIKAASITELGQVKTISSINAEMIFNFFKDRDETELN